MEEIMKSHRLPETDSIDELARFWDTHDLTDLEPFLVEVKEPVFVRANRASIGIDLPPGETGRVRSIARSEGVEETTLLRQWVLEKLRQYPPRARSNRSTQPLTPRRRGQH